MPHAIHPLRDSDYPSTVPGPLPGEPQKWPGVIGVISIVLASLGLLCGGCGSAWVLMAPSFMKQAEQQMGGAAPDVMLPGMGQLIMMIVGTLWALVLLTAGIMLVRRKEASRKVYFVYAIVAILLGIVSLGMTVQQQLAAMAWAKDNPSDPWAQQVSPIGLIISLVIGIFIGLGWPVFCLVWFGVIKRREVIQPLPEIVA